MSSLDDHDLRTGSTMVPGIDSLAPILPVTTSQKGSTKIVKQTFKMTTDYAISEGPSPPAVSCDDCLWAVSDGEMENVDEACEALRL